MRKALRVIGVLGLAALSALQLANPSHQNPPVVVGHDVFATNAPPPAIAAIFRDSCCDCQTSIIAYLPLPGCLPLIAIP